MARTRFESKINRIAEKVHQGKKVESTPRELLRSFGAERRTQQICHRIRIQLDSLGLITMPDFELYGFDSKIWFKLAPSHQAASDERDVLKSNVIHSEPESEERRLTRYDIQRRLTRVIAEIQEGKQRTKKISLIRRILNYLFR